MKGFIVPAFTKKEGRSLKIICARKVITIIMNSYSANPAMTVADAPVSDRSAFISRVFLHLGLAILLFVGLEAYLILSGAAKPVVDFMFSFGKYSWLFVLGAFMAASWIANKLAMSEASQEIQYAGLGLYIVAEALIFLPLLYVAASVAPSTIPAAGIITGLLTLGLIAVAFITRKDFSFLKGILIIGSFVAIGIIVASIFFGFELGVLFSAIMVLFAGASILYTLSNIIHHYNTKQHVAAALALFAGVALLFWYVLRILMALRK